MDGKHGNYGNLRTKCIITCSHTRQHSKHCAPFKRHAAVFPIALSSLCAALVALVIGEQPISPMICVDGNVWDKRPRPQPDPGCVDKAINSYSTHLDFDCFFRASRPICSPPFQLARSLDILDCARAQNNSNISNNDKTVCSSVRAAYVMTPISYWEKLNLVADRRSGNRPWCRHNIL